MRILALETDAFGGRGGISRYNRDFLTALSRSGLVDEVLVLPRLGGADNEPVPPRVQQLPPIPGRIAYVAKAASVIRHSRSFDVIYCGHLLMAPLAALLARWKKVPMWLQLHGIDAWDRPGPLVRWAAEQSTLVTTVSRFTKHKFLGWANISPDKVKVLPNTVSERFSPGTKSAEIQEKFGLADARVLLTLSRISPADWYKGFDQVISALPDLLNEYPNLRYVIAGDGDGRPALEQLAQRLGVAHAVRFIGRVDDSLLPDLYRTADIYVMPSSKEGFGIVFLEALNSGIPVIGGNMDGSVDPLGDGQYGITIRCGNRDELVAAIRRVFESRQPVSDGFRKFDRANFERHCRRLLAHLVSRTVV